MELIKKGFIENTYMRMISAHIIKQGKKDRLIDEDSPDDQPIKICLNGFSGDCFNKKTKIDFMSKVSPDKISNRTTMALNDFVDSDNVITICVDSQNKLRICGVNFIFTGKSISKIIGNDEIFQQSSEKPIKQEPPKAESKGDFPDTKMSKESPENDVWNSSDIVQLHSPAIEEVEEEVDDSWEDDKSKHSDIVKKLAVEINEKKKSLKPTKLVSEKIPSDTIYSDHRELLTVTEFLSNIE